MTTNNKIICFDVDGTLVDGVSWLLLTAGLGCSVQKHLNIFHRARKGEISFAEGERRLTKMYQESGRGTKTFIRKLFARIEPRKAARNLFKYLKKKGYTIYLISGAIDIYVAAVAQKLGADGFYANSTLNFDQNGVLTKIHYRDNQGEVKVQQLREISQKHKINLTDIIFVGDSENDLAAFRVTGKGIAAASANEELKKVAWKQIDSLQAVKALDLLDKDVI